MFVGTHKLNKEKTNTRRNTNAQKITSCVTLKRWAHLTSQTDVQSPGTHITMTRTHLSVTQSKVVANSGKRGLAEPVDWPNPD